MAVKHDGNKRWVEMQLDLSATPEQVWDAIATSSNAAWFTKADIEPRVGGALRFDFGGGMISKGEVTTWDPPRVFGYVEREWAEGAPPVATEITITSRAGNRCVLRMVHSLFTSEEDWDDQLESFEGGWPGFFVLLRAYLAYFAGAPAASFMAMAPATGDALTVWKRLCGALGLVGAEYGEHRSVTTSVENLAGVVDHVHQDASVRYVMVRLDAGLVLVGLYVKPTGVTTSLCRYFYGADAAARAAELEPAWRAWLTALVSG
jgi:uncharacterized protein YndB with AHSA1/START domain